VLEVRDELHAGHEAEAPEVGGDVADGGEPAGDEGPARAQETGERGGEGG
jgi:hypothetical protein